MVLSNKVGTELTFIEILFAIIIGQLLVSFWQKSINNFTYNTLHLNKDSTYHTFIIALTATFIFLIYIFSSDTIFDAVLETDTGGNVPIPPNIK